MSQESRRRVLKGLGVALPAAWARPVVEAVVLPAHAQTSPTAPVNCSAPPDCYISGSNSFRWPGGAGPFDTDFYGNAECFGDPVGDGPLAVVVAASQAEAEAALGCAAPGEISTTPAPPGGCRFFGCGVAP